MAEKTFKIVNGDMSDGYHTFDELYEHRCLLFINWMVSDGCPGRCYWLREHFEGWDLIVCEVGRGEEQISYHVPKKYRELYESVIDELQSFEHVWDGHTSADVIARLHAHAKAT